MADINKGRLLGAHCSTTGGLAKAIERAAKLGCNVVQIFTKNSNQWKAPTVGLDEIDAFKAAVRANKIKRVFAHAGYLANLATVDPVIQQSTLESVLLELKRAESLDIPYLIVHPGSHKGAGELVGILQLVENLRRLREEMQGAKVQLLLETTAGQGTGLGYDFSHFAEVFDRSDWPEDLGLCVDTSHIFQAGYDISTAEGYRAVMLELDAAVGLKYVQAFHLNDSAKECGSRVDRHEDIGKGKIGETAFKLLLQDKRFVHIPMLIETPKKVEHESDLKNLTRLRSYLK